MLKLLLLAGVLAAVYFVFFKKKGSLSSPSDAPGDDAMIPCSRCGTYVQTKEALLKEGRHYCSRECMEG